MAFIDLGYIQEKILQLEKNPPSLKKFFGGKIVDERASLLVEQDAKEDPEKENKRLRLLNTFNEMLKFLIKQNDNIV